MSTGGYEFNSSDNTNRVTFIGGTFGDVLRAGSGVDSLNGDGGNDVLEGGAGGDSLTGGDGNDTASYESAGPGLRVYLSPAIGEVAAGDALGDTFTAIENIRGSANDDVIGGNGSANRLEGGSGADTMDGRGGDDALDGGGGADTAVFSGARSDYTVTNLSGGGVRIADNRSATPDGTDTISNVELFRFSSGTLTRAQLNDAPALTGAQANLPAGSEDAAYTVSEQTLLQGYTDANSDMLTVTGLAADRGTVTDNGDGTYTITPEPNYSGSIKLTYGVSDGAATVQATRSFTLNAVNDAPTASGLTQSLTVAEDAAAAALFTSAVSVSDIDSASLTATLTLGNAAAGVLTGGGFVGQGNGVYTITGTPAAVQSALAAVRFDSAGNYNGSVDVAVAIGDGQSGPQGTNPSGTVSITVTPVNDAPTASGLTQSLTVAEDAAAAALFTNAVSVSDIDSASLTATLTLGDAAAGVLTGGGFVAQGSGVYTITGTPAAVQSALAAVRFDSADDYNGSVSVAVAIGDGQNGPQGTNPSGSVSITVTPVNDAPTARDDAKGVLQRQTLTGNVITDAPADSDPDMGDTLTVTQIAISGSASPVAAADTPVQGAQGTLTIKNDGAYSYAADVEGTIAVGDTRTDTFTYTLSDGQGGTDTADLTVTVTGSGTGTDGANTFLLTGSGTSASGLAGGDVYIVDQSTDQVVEAAGGGIDLVKAFASYTLSDNVENLSFYGRGDLDGTGNAGNNVIRGNGGDNVLAGKLGNDTLIGGGGNDTFLFDTAPGPRNVDHIEAFSVKDDTIALDNKVFKGLVNGPLKVGQFKDITDGAALDADDRILYDHESGRLWHDADGSGSGARVQFAILDNHPTLTFEDFLVV